MNEAFYKFLGLGTRSGKLVFGAQAVKHAIKSRKAKLVFIDNFASQNTKKEITDACNYYHIKLIILEEEGLLGVSVGKPKNMIIGITCADFALAARNKLSTHSEG